MLRGENGTTLQAALGAIEDDNGLEVLVITLSSREKKRFFFFFSLGQTDAKPQDAHCLRHPC